MLRGIQKASSGRFGKIVMGVIMGTLALSFAIWGIGDIFRGFGQSTVAKIGGKDVTIEQFRNYYTDKVNQLGRRVGRPVTGDQVRALGIDRQILGQYVAEQTLDQAAARMRLGASNEQISNFIAADPNFRGLTGQFDRNQFQQMIRQAGYSEQSYVNEQRQVTVRRQLAMSVSGDVKPPAAMLDAVNRFQNEKRSADIVTLTAAQAGEIAKPDEAALQKYFDERKILFRAPETRKITLLVLSPADQARWNVVSDADARAAYEQRKAEFGSAEKRELRQMVFASADEAQAASDKIAAGTSFEDVAKARALMETDLDIGSLTKANIIDPAVADAAFSVKEGDVTPPVQGRFGIVILQVKKIVPATQQPYEAVADQIKKTIGEQRARTEISSLRDKIEDERAGGATLAEAAAKLSLQTRVIDAIDRSGRDGRGQPIADLPQADIVGTAFSTDVGVEADSLQTQNGGLVWVDVNGITPARDRSYEEVKDQVEARWRDDQVTARLKTKADEMLEKLKAGSALAAVAAESNVPVVNAADLQRGKPTAQVGANALTAIFRTAKGAAGSAEGDKPGERTVFVVTNVTVPDAVAGSPEAKQIAETLQRGYGEDLVTEYVGKLEADIGVTINETALRQVTGVSAN